jgi:plasmid stabilization system protein ParE
MALEIKWSKTANNDLYRITTYLEQYLSEDNLISFIDSVFKCLDQIAAFPEIGIIENKQKKMRSFLINKNCRVFYRITDIEVILLAFIDTRSNPQNRPK